MKRASLVVLVAVVAASCGGDNTTISSTEGSAAPTSSTITSTTTTVAETTTTSASTSSTSSTEGETSRENPVPVGEVVQVGDWRLRVASVIPDGTHLLEEDFNEPPGEGEQDFVVGLEATYTGTEVGKFWLDFTLKAVGRSSVAYESFTHPCGLIPDDITQAGDAFPGGTVTGNSCWRIRSEDANSMVLVAEQFVGFDPDRVFLSLDSSVTPAEDTTSIGDPNLDRSGATPVGETASVGPWDIKVTSVTFDATDAVLAEAGFNEPPQAGNQYFIATLEATYTGEESSDFFVDMSLDAVGDSSVTYDDITATCGTIPDDIRPNGEVFPGGTITGNVCWEVRSTDADALVMLAEESNTFDEVRVMLSLNE